MDFDIPKDLQDYLSVLDDFIEAEIKPLENENDNIRFFDHRREDARTDWDRGGLPSEEWEALLGEHEGKLLTDLNNTTRSFTPFLNEFISIGPASFLELNDRMCARMNRRRSHEPDSVRKPQGTE